ncbi:dipeptidase AC. Metallo peptidase. MEROPS family M19 [Cribrihabitans marinus]|uniref:Dipeptidase AC. Metallo peptidase. MEROPS family M19 n=1 Tax=Cribrihabitans marinus TaxID=1227549 RepID=A0A1H6WC51_9RHOB|nr:dipeptidase [Cribrihabitans marinus]GGH24936.1 membrane dipeptidase [Cribrihabitans marinus]SEJ09895.1 dipeptidase AC. Metallo peptidase. MEROPS family M19 [Cribrihabitans marinus]
MAATQPAIIDGHNDVLLKLYRAGGPARAQGFLDGLDGALDLPKARTGGFGGGFFAVYVPSPTDREFKMEEMSKPKYDLPLPEPIDWEDAVPVVLSQAATLLELERAGALVVCRSAADMRAALQAGRLAAIFHIEGAEAIDPDLHMLDVLHAAGLRSLGPVWSRSTIFGHGVPFRYPSSPDIGAGLTDHGIRLVRRCNALGIMLDLSHLNEAGFWDVARHSDKPLVATHSNAHAICPHSRNLTDEQLRAIAESDGMVGVNFAAAFLRPDGQMNANVPISVMLDHLDHLMGILGEDRVGLGSDYDGAVVPQMLTTVADLPKLRQAMTERGYGDTLIAKLCHENWLRVLEKTWGS